jgi:hypothetical protein
LKAGTIEDWVDVRSEGHGVATCLASRARWQIRRHCGFYSMIRPRHLVCLTVLLCLPSCVARDRLNSDCRWTGDAARPLNLNDRADDRHLLDDVTLAEELAIRAADVRRGHRSGRFDGTVTYAAARESCMATLFEAAAASHHVSPTEVRARLGRRVLWVDLVVGGLFATFYTLGAIAATRHLDITYSRERRLTSLVAILTASIAVSAVGVVAGELWSLLAEGFRVSSNNHISYRAARIPWAHHRADIFAVGLVLFWVVALRPHRRTVTQGPEHAP